MNFIRTSIFILLAAFTFFGNVGFSVFTHTCKKDGVSRSYFIQQNHNCEQHQEESLPPCCKKKAIKDDNCCNDEVDVVKIKLDFHNDYHPRIETLCFNLASNKFKFEEKISFASNDKLTDFIHPPPKPWGKEILILHQVFRI